ncbi:MAG: AMP-binding protein [Bacteroidota bacterium]
MSYPFSAIWINGRDVSLESIAHETARSDFEKNTFQFIEQWFGGQPDFTMTTSGSTGTPKPIVASKEQMTTSAKLTTQALGLKKNWNALVCLDTKYIAGKMMLVRSFVAGMKIFCVEPTANPFQKLPESLLINFTALVPYQIQNILETNAKPLNEVDRIIIGGAPLDADTRMKLDDHSSPCYATYGMTETLSHVALQRLNGPEKQNYFQTLPDISIRSDQRGCLAIKTSFLSDEIITNDIVEIISPKQFRWLGRWDNVINSGGIKVIPEKIEEKLEEIFRRLNIKNRFFIHGIPDRVLGHKVVLVLEGHSGLPGLLERVQNDLRLSFTAYEIPREILIVPQFWLTSTGKINRLKSIF